jgi:microsomal dipeptidase-like Zn-dependent dipeptidase
LTTQGVTEGGWGDDDFSIPEPPIAGYRDWRVLPKLTEAMVRRGSSEDGVRGILELNFVRVFRDTGP